MKTICSLSNPESSINPQKTIKYSDILDSIDILLENVDLAFDKIKV